jgi:hypothetical protein
MSLAFRIDVAGSDVTGRAAALAGLVMSALLVLAAVEQLHDEEIGIRAWLGLACAAACSAWCVLQRRWLAARRPLRLRVAADGSVVLVAHEDGEELPAEFVGAWVTGGLACLRLCPAGKPLGSADCLLLLTRGSLGHARWHALRRWLVWQRRSSGRRPISRAPESVAA